MYFIANIVSICQYVYSFIYYDFHFSKRKCMHAVCVCVLCADSLLFCKMDIYKIYVKYYPVYHYFAAKDIDIASFVVGYNSPLFISRCKAIAIWTYGSIVAASSSDERGLPLGADLSVEKAFRSGMWVRRACEVKRM